MIKAFYESKRSYELAVKEEELVNVCDSITKEIKPLPQYAAQELQGS